jgi:hypothetical protein
MPGENTLMEIIDKGLTGVGEQEPAEAIEWFPLVVVETVANFLCTGCLMGKENHSVDFELICYNIVLTLEGH